MNFIKFSLLCKKESGELETISKMAHSIYGPIIPCSLRFYPTSHQ